MKAFWLTYKPITEAPEYGWPKEELSELVRRFEKDPENTTEWWRISSHKKARVGDRVYIFKQGSGPRGIFGVGKIVKGPELRKNISLGKEPDYQAEISFMGLVDPSKEFLLTWSQIQDLNLGNLPRSERSGNEVEGAMEALERRLAPWTMQSIESIEQEPFGEVFNGSNQNETEGEQELRRQLRAIIVRKGQADFRADLIEAYDGQCVITRCKILEVLEAAHIMPYSVNQITNKNNGLLLRADIHTLFDRGLIAINPSTRDVVISSELKFSKSYATLEGRVIVSPRNPDDSPSRANLQWKFSYFETVRKIRSKFI